MELADLAQPRKLALEIHRQLREQYGAVPCKVPLFGIAEAVGIVTVEEHDLPTFDGTLVVQGDKGAISIRGRQTTGRRNFTLGHELGHFLNPWHRNHGTRFQCTKLDLRAERGRASTFDHRPQAERIEVEANEFSAALLIPAPEYRQARARLGRDVQIGHIQHLKEAFDVSLEFMARTFVETSQEKLAVIISQNAVVARVYARDGFPYLGLRRGAPIPSSSLTERAARSRPPGTESDLIEMSTAVWLDQARGVSALYEQVLVQREGWAITLLSVEEEERSDED